MRRAIESAQAGTFFGLRVHGRTVHVYRSRGAQLFTSPDAQAFECQSVHHARWMADELATWIPSWSWSLIALLRLAVGQCEAALRIAHALEPGGSAELIVHRARWAATCLREEIQRQPNESAERIVPEVLEQCEAAMRVARRRMYGPRLRRWSSPWSR